MAAGLTLDSGALIAAEKGERHVWKLCKEAAARGAQVTVPTAVLAQVWRGNSPVVARLLQGCELDDLDGEGAKGAGELLARSRTSDVVDAAVVLGAAARRDAVVTSDPVDIARLIAAAGSKIRVLPV